MYQAPVHIVNIRLQQFCAPLFRDNLAASSTRFNPASCDVETAFIEFNDLFIQNCLSLLLSDTSDSVHSYYSCRLSK